MMSFWQSPTRMMWMILTTIEMKMKPLIMSVWFAHRRPSQTTGFVLVFLKDPMELLHSILTNCFPRINKTHSRYGMIKHNINKRNAGCISRPQTQWLVKEWYDSLPQSGVLFRELHHVPPSMQPHPGCQIQTRATPSAPPRQFGQLTTSNTLLRGTL